MKKFEFLNDKYNYYGGLEKGNEYCKQTMIAIMECLKENETKLIKLVEQYKNLIDEIFEIPEENEELRDEKDFKLYDLGATIGALLLEKSHYCSRYGMADEEDPYQGIGVNGWDNMDNNFCNNQGGEVYLFIDPFDYTIYVDSFKFED